ncbi:hypothetical protein [Hymenobacter crusticola]|uniref:Uncharacterized protein n=1 Tax=Hymenobacter crusticola TaxID=1770526 RepID=A0A243WE25_9BACT|nr:hypothetical protein [Hymenobacter crusticola]OUJ73117.1 hypothetical protein BXP70_14885 [Hymenobacter crusticola]
MDNSAATNTKKCPHCGQWSAWALHHEDRCTHCGELLDPQAYQQVIQRDAAEQENEKAPRVFIKIDPADGLFTRLWKYVVLSGQVLFAAIISFFLWLGVVLAG